MDIAALTQHDGLGVGKDGGNLKTAGALDVHEKGIGGLHKAFQFVCSEIVFWSRMQQIARHFDIGEYGSIVMGTDIQITVNFQKNERKE